MTWLARLLPQPFLSLAIVALWMALAQEPGLGDLLLATALGLVVPWSTRSLWPDPPRLRRPLAALALLLRVIGDIVVANWQVARLVLGPLDRLRPGFLYVPIAITDPFVATLLGSIVTLTPGSVSVEIDREKNELIVYALHVDDADAFIATIKRRYEAPLREIFGC
jgi:multicomponent K+:H+ antiporter subunit E